MSGKLLKVDPRSDDAAEGEFSLDYFRSLTTAARFRMIVDRSILLLGLAATNEADRETPKLVKRR